MPFLLPLLLQEGFDRTPFESGLITFASALGALTMKTVATRVLRRCGFRPVLIVNALLSAVFLAACAGFTASTPVAVIMVVLLVGGFFRSLQFTSTNALAYAEVETERMSRATVLAAVGQQLSISAGVAIGAAVVEAMVAVNGTSTITAADFPAAFLVVAAISAASALLFAQLPRNAGEEMAGRGGPR
jgi:fucose permease